LTPTRPDRSGRPATPAPSGDAARATAAPTDQAADADSSASWNGWRAMFEFNLLSAVRTCRAAIPLLVERGGCAIVNVSSGHGRQPSAANVHYGAAKAAMINLTKALSEEFATVASASTASAPGR
jgi:NAD(P)-dependent dehydrogenase (short-subunit alcohol dehydrogenase family)